MRHVYTCASKFQACLRYMFVAWPSVWTQVALSCVADRCYHDLMCSPTCRAPHVAASFDSGFLFVVMRIAMVTLLTTQIIRLLLRLFDVFERGAWLMVLVVVRGAAL